MSIVVVTGSGGLIGSEAAKYYHEQGYEVIGIDNNMRSYFFGESASVNWNIEKLKKDCANYRHYDLDIRNHEGVLDIFAQHKGQITCVIHSAAQPSHDWAANEPLTDFSINATGTINMLEATRLHCPESVFIFTSTNKVYGDTPNFLPLLELEERFELSEDHPYYEYGIDESMSIDTSKHSIFGASKVAADIMVQEYGKYFGMKTGTFRGGCLTGPAHSGAELHGFLAYIVICAVTGKHYNIFGYKGKQVRDNIHSKDLISAFWSFTQNPKPGEVYNMGGSRHSNVSMLETIRLIEELGGYKLNYTILDDARIGDHMWYISDVRKFQGHYPEWKYQYDINSILKQIIKAVEDR